MALDVYSLPEELEAAITLAEGWTLTGLDLGEVHVTTPLGQKFRLVVEGVREDEDFI